MTPTFKFNGGVLIELFFFPLIFCARVATVHLYTQIIFFSCFMPDAIHLNLDSNLKPQSYETAALTPELQQPSGA